MRGLKLGHNTSVGLSLHIEDDLLSPAKQPKCSSEAQFLGGVDLEIDFER
jgi:hypothetical protein